jgi:hypothetical protein
MKHFSRLEYVLGNVDCIILAYLANTTYIKTLQDIMARQKYTISKC